MAIRNYEQHPGYQPAPMVDAGVGALATAEAWHTAVAVLGKTSDIAFERAARQAEITGRLAGAKDAVQFDEHGNLLPLSTLPPEDSIYGKAYREAAVSNYALALGSSSEIKAQELEQQFQGDPEGYRQAWNSYQLTTLKSVDPSIAPVIEPHLVRVGGNSFARLADAKATADRKDAITGIQNQIQQMVGGIAGRVQSMGFTTQSLMVAQQMVMKEVNPLLIQWGNIDKSFGPNQQKEAARKVMQMGVSFLVSSEAVKRASGTVVDPATGMPGANVAGSDSFLASAYGADPDLQQLYTPDEWQGVVRDARQQVALMAAGKEMGYRAAYAAASTQVQNNLAALDGALMQAKLAFVTTGDASGLQTLLQKAKGMRLGLTGEQQARAMGQLQSQVADVAYSVLSNPNKMAAIDYANRIAGGEKIQLPDGAVGQDAALFVKPRFGVGDPTQANPDGWAAYYGSTGRLTDLDKQIFGTVSYATDPEKLAAISSNFAAMHEKDPKISEQIDGKAAELLMDFNRFVVQGHGDLKEWQSLHKDALKMDQTERAAQTARIAITGYNDAPARAAELTTGLRQALDQTGVISSMWRGIFGGNLPTSAELVPDVNRQNVMGLVLSFMPNGVNMALGGRPIDVPIVITAGAQQSYNVQWTSAVHRAGPLTAPGQALNTLALGKVGLSALTMPDPGQALDTTALYLTQAAPEAVFQVGTAQIAGQLAHDLASNEKIHPSMLAEGSAPSTAVDWKTEVLAGRVRLEPVLTGNGSAVSGYRVYWYADPARDPIPMEVGGKLWKYDGHPDRTTTPRSWHRPPPRPAARPRARSPRSSARASPRRRSPASATAPPRTSARTCWCRRSASSTGAARRSGATRRASTSGSGSRPTA